MPLLPARPRRDGWDLTALLTAADPQASLAERHLWLVRLLGWLRRDGPREVDTATGERPAPVLRLQHLLNVLERHPEQRERVAAVLAAFWQQVDSASLFADYGFSPRAAFLGDLSRRLRQQWLPLTPATSDLAELFGLLFPDAADADWLEAIDEDTLARLVALVVPAMPDARAQWRAPLLDAITFLASAVRAAGFSPLLRPRMTRELQADAAFRQLARAAEQVRDAAEDGDAALLLQHAQFLRALLDICRQCADSVHDHLEEHGISVNVVFEVDQLRDRTRRIEELLNALLSPTPARETARLFAALVREADERRSVRALFAQHYSRLARKVAERSAASGEHYITRDRDEYRAMLRAAAGGGSVMAVTTFAKFGIGALGLSAFWAGFFAGTNYALSFVIVQLLHWTIATKQPAMTAPAMAAALRDVATDEGVEAFVDRIAALIRSQAAGIFGNLMLVAPLVLAGQWAAIAIGGQPLVGVKEADHVLHALTLLGPTALYAAFTGVLLFGSSLIAGWVENWFVFHRLDSAIEWNPRAIALLGAARARRWAVWWRENISGLAANVSLGLMLGLVPAIALFFGLPLEVRHVTLSTGQLAAAVGAKGTGLLETPAFWWCAAGIAVTGVLNLTVSFGLAFKVALRSRGIRLAERSRIRAAVWRRLKRAPLSFLWPPA